MGGSERPGQICPPVVDYSQSALDRAAGEISDLPDGTILTGMLSDYTVMREQARSCAARH